MCGIFGRFSTNAVNGITAELCAATNYLSHRGPDDGAWWSDGPFFLGHRRLSIIDTVHGVQPMPSADNRYVISFNGEIYNYIELRLLLVALGYKFLTNSDTEVVLAGYSIWGEEVCSKLSGMFAFAIADRKTNSLFLARDRFGEKPLFIFEQVGSITFASELGAFCQLSEFKPTIDMNGLSSFLCLNYVPGNRTLINSISRLPPATWRRYSFSEKIEQCYWRPISGVIKMSTSEALGELQQRIDASLNICLRSDVPVALFLSGGIDSSLVAESAVRQRQLKHAYCLDIQHEGYSEISNATFVAKRLGLELHKIPLTEQSIFSFFDIVGHLDDPLADSSALAMWTLARETAKDFKVVISGDGGDELFGGYLTYPASLIHQALISNLPMTLRKIMVKASGSFKVGTNKVGAAFRLARFFRAADLPSSNAHYSWNGTWLPNDAASFLNDPADALNAQNVLNRLAHSHSLGDKVSLSNLQIADIYDYLPNDILTKIDRSTMAFGLEARAPLLDVQIANFALSLPNHLRITRFLQTKRLLRLLAGRHFGSKIGTAKKQGFSIPVHEWLRGSARELMEDLLSPSSLCDLPFLNAALIQQTIDAHMRRERQLGFELWGLMVLVAWFRLRIQLKGLVRHSTNLRRIVLKGYI